MKLLAKTRPGKEPWLSFPNLCLRQLRAYGKAFGEVFREFSLRALIHVLVSFIYSFNKYLSSISYVPLFQTLEIYQLTKLISSLSS